MRVCYRGSAFYSLILAKEAFYAENSSGLGTHPPPFPLELGRYRCGTFGVGVKYINKRENEGVGGGDEPYEAAQACGGYFEGRS